MHTNVFSRRTLLRAGAAIAGSGLLRGGSEKPRPRAISGDTVEEPRWDQRVTITVGPEKADLCGTSDRVIQAAVDYAARLGGGTVRILPGTYHLRNAVYLPSRTRLHGSGDASVLIKGPSVTTRLVANTDWYDQEVTLADPTGFTVGDGVCLRARSPHGGKNVVKRTLVARNGNRFKLDRAPRKNFWLSGEARIETLFPILSGENVEDIVIENLTLDGNKNNNQNLDGNHAGCIFLQDANRITLQGVTARNYNGDGISWQICHDVTVTGCHSHDHTGLGLHPGSGSQRPIMTGNTLTRNRIGIFFCWGVRHGRAENNRLEQNHTGVSIGHRDSDNLVRDNDIVGSRKVGVLFRKETPAFAPNRNRIEKNRITNTGPDDGVAIDVGGETEGNVLAKNILRETRGAAQRTGIRIGAETRTIQLQDNRIEGFATPVRDLRA